MSSESEQRVVESGSEEEQSDGSESEEVESESEEEVETEPEVEHSNSEVEEEEEDNDAESDSEDDEVDDISTQKNSKSHKKKETISLDQRRLEWKKEVLERYENMIQRKNLRVVFPHVIPDEKLEETVKGLCKRIVKVSRTANSNKQQCFVYFNSVKALIESLKDLRRVNFGGHGLTVQIPKLEWEIGQQKIVNDGLLDSPTHKPEKTCTSTIVVLNIPENSTISHIKELFPNAVEIKVDFAQNQNTAKATVRLPTVKDATLAINTTYKIGGNVLKISYDIPETDIKCESLTQTSHQINGQSKHGSMNLKGGKHKLEEPSAVEYPSPKKGKQNDDRKNKGENGIISKEKDVQKIKKNKLSKELSKIKGVNKADIEHSKSISKEKKNKKNIEKVLEDTVTEKKKVKKEKLEKPLKLKKPKVK